MRLLQRQRQTSKVLLQRFVVILILRLKRQMMHQQLRGALVEAEGKAGEGAFQHRQATLLIGD